MENNALNYSLRLGVLKEASIDYRYLLSRGYNREISLKFVGDRYGLTKAERMALFRSVFPKDEAIKRMAKLSSPEAMMNKSISIDGFNVLMTIKAALQKFPLLLCDDGFIRDILSVIEKVKISRDMYIAIELLMQILLKYKPREVF